MRCLLVLALGAVLFGGCATTHRLGPYLRGLYTEGDRLHVRECMLAETSTVSGRQVQPLHEEGCRDRVIALPTRSDGCVSAEDDAPFQPGSTGAPWWLAASGARPRHAP